MKVDAFLAVVSVMALAAQVPAGIPQPDAALYGRVFIKGQPVTAEDDVTVVARVAGVENPVGVYKMGASSTAGDNYVLRIRLESLADGSPQSDNTAIVGDTVQVFVKQADGPEELVTDFSVKSIGSLQHLDLGEQDCNIDRPSVVHATGKAGSVTHPCSGYIDPRAESSNGATLDLGITAAVIKFNVEVFKSDGSSDVDESSFIITETGAGPPPNIIPDGVDYVGGDKALVRVEWDRPITLQEWTTIQAVVFNGCGDQIETSASDKKGNSPDRVDIGFLPSDVDQGGTGNPFDLLVLRQLRNDIVEPTDVGCSNLDEDYIDINRSCEKDPLPDCLSPFDLLALRQLRNNIQGIVFPTKAWSGESMNNPRP